MTIPETIVEVLHEREQQKSFWIYGGELARAVAGILKKKESNIERRMREMDEELEQRYVPNPNGKGCPVVQYKLKSKEPEQLVLI